MLKHKLQKKSCYCKYITLFTYHFNACVTTTWLGIYTRFTRYGMMLSVYWTENNKNKLKFVKSWKGRKKKVSLLILVQLHEIIYCFLLSQFTTIDLTKNLCNELVVNVVSFTFWIATCIEMLGNFYLHYLLC